MTSLHVAQDAVRVSRQVLQDYGPNSPEAAGAAAAAWDATLVALDDGATVAQLYDWLNTH
jgi:hypothetical protein